VGPAEIDGLDAEAGGALVSGTPYGMVALISVKLTCATLARICATLVSPPRANLGVQLFSG
jgi:hypothetical protein